MSTIALNAALTGLKAAQAALNAVSTNVANASTPGYSRKILQQETMLAGNIGVGVQSSSLIRNVDRILLRDTVNQLSISQNYAQRESYLTRVQQFHGASDANASVGAEINKLMGAFSDLSARPDSDLSLDIVLNTSQQIALKFNKFSQLITNMRNDAQSDIGDRIRKVNEALVKIADYNRRVSNTEASGQSAADLEDQRDQTLRELSQYMQISSFIGDNNTLIVMTRQGATLADSDARTLVFNKTPIGPESYYPGGGAAGIYIGSELGTDITATDLGGEIGALVTLRDETLASYHAQLDELAQKLASRLDGQGLTLFTDSNGTVPADVADPLPPDYVGFAARIRVNSDIISDPTLIRSGTYGQTVLEGSNEIIRKISEFAFGQYAYFEATGDVDISAGDLFTTLGIAPFAQVIGTQDITDIVPTLDTNPAIVAGSTFDIDIDGNTQTITINGGDTSTDLVNNINAAFGSTVARLNGLGQLVIEGAGDITLTDGTLGAAGASALGISFATTTATDPAFQIQVGTQSPVTINITTADTSVELLAQLNAVPGITASLDGSGFLVITPTQGGDIKLIDGQGSPAFAMGLRIAGVAHSTFRQNNLGVGGDLSTGLLSNATLADYARGLVASQSEDATEASEGAQKEQSYFDLLNTRQQNQSGVDIDQEISELVRIQSAYTAAARMISVTEKLFDEFFNSVLR